MRKRTSNKHGRVWPHNAIYEILAGRCAGITHEPMVYSQRTVRVFYKILDTVGIKTREAYELIFEHGYTFKEAAKFMQMSPTSVRRYMDKIYMYREQTEFLVDRLLNSVVYSNDKKELSDEFIDSFIKDRNISVYERDTIKKIISMRTEGMYIVVIARKLSLTKTYVSYIMSEYEKYCSLMKSEG